MKTFCITIVIGLALLSILFIYDKPTIPIEPTKQNHEINLIVMAGDKKVAIKCEITDKGDAQDFLDWVELTNDVIQNIKANCETDKRCIDLASGKYIESSCEDFESTMDAWMLQDKLKLSAKCQTKVDNLIQKGILVEEVKL